MSNKHFAMRSGALLFAAAAACALVLSVEGNDPNKLRPAKACQDLRCPINMLFRGTFTNASYVTLERGVCVCEVCGAAQCVVRKEAHT